MLEEIKDELEKRSLLKQIIAHLIDKNFQVKEKYHLRRGKVQSIIAQALGVVQNNTLAALVIEHLESIGAETCVIHGALYFKNLTNRQPEVKIDYINSPNRKRRKKPVL